ncbi:CCR4-NOT transcription complex subunit 10-like isoform X2 [Actinia tenebrosa]|uniref:CCR4-NOT transcription complex subunit 10 n=1 Tax=Actinia tenebrosa TaxID=6105 RepID=A0A6P8IF97_ACTTE|nr:CCR4-NOT transcription complex subunit 10-like isoform X2 [Actinia tenebrosa]
MTDVEQSFVSSLEIPEDLPVSGIRITDEEREIANQAQIEFENCRYEKSVEALDSLSEIRQNDHKVIHNKAVAQFCHSEFTKTDEFYKNLLSIKKQIENQTGDDGDESDDIDMAYLLYNEAVVCYNLRQYNAAVCTLNRLFNVIEPLDENLALKVCLLLAELHLIMYKPDKARVVLSHIENLILENIKLNETSQQGNSTSLSKDVDENLKGRYHELRTRQNLMTKSMKACKREIKEVFNSNTTPNGFFLKSNFEYLRQNYRKSIKLLNSAPKTGGNVLETGESLSTMYFNNLGCIHYQMHKYNLAAFYSRQALEENDKALSSLPPSEKNNPLHSCPLATLRLSQRHEILYNLGIQLLFSGRPEAAFDCLVESIQTYHTNPRLWLRLAECCILSHHMMDDSEDQNRIRKSDIVKSVIGSGPHRKIILASLLKEKGLISADNENKSAAMPACTLEFSSICLQNALLLLNVGEDDLKSMQQSCTVENHVEKHDFDGLEMNGSIESDMPRKMSTGSVECSILALPGPPIRLKEIPNIRCAMLCCSAYVSLGLGDNVTALVHAQRLLEHTNISGSHKFLGHLYAAESLIKLNRISEAIMHLSPDNVNDIDIGGPVVECPGGGSEKVDKERDTRPHCCGKIDFPQSSNEGKAALLCNLASTYCLKNEYDKAKRCLSQAGSLGAQKSLTARMVLLAVYIELKCGNVTNALQIIKKNQFLQFSNGKVKQSKRLSDYWKT